MKKKEKGEEEKIVHAERFFSKFQIMIKTIVE